MMAALNEMQVMKSGWCVGELEAWVIDDLQS